MLSVSLGDWELGNSASQEPFLLATVLRRLKTAWRFERGDTRQVVAGSPPGLGFGPGDD